MRQDEQIAVVGMACRFPGADSLESFWQLLEQGKCAVTDGRQDHGPWSGVLGDPNARDIFSRRGGFVCGIDRFDAKFFGITPIEARITDPRRRILLETCFHALEDGGIPPESIKGSRTGVYIGMGGHEYRDIVLSKGEDTYVDTHPSMTAGRVAFVLGTVGPAMPVDMACTSSLAAIYHAILALERNEIETAVVGGVNAIFSPVVNKFIRELGMLSKKGRCAAFDANADGMVRGEGCGVIVLKKISRAKADGNRIWATIRSLAIGQNGAGTIPLLPNVSAQQQIMHKALFHAGVKPLEIDYLEAQGTGLPLGDAAEINAIAAVYGNERTQKNPLLVGSVKTNIGHLEWASGMASIIKVILSMNKKVIPRQLYFEKPSKESDLNKFPVQVVCENMPWHTQSREPLAGVSASGVNGSNVHVILEGYSSNHPTSEKSNLSEVYPLPISAKSEQALRRLAKAYLNLLSEKNFTKHKLADMAWTACLGRDHFSYRVCPIFSNQKTLELQLKALAEHGAWPTFNYKENKSAEKIADTYQKGGDVSFAELFDDQNRCRVSLPSYPFEHESYWVLN